MRFFYMLFFVVAIQLQVCAQQMEWIAYPNAPFSERDDAVGASTGDYVFVGTGMNNSFNLLNDWWGFNFWTEQWSQFADFPGGARQYAVAFVHNQSVFVAGGVGDSGYFNDLWEYNTADDSWQQKASLPAQGRSSGAVFTIENYTYLCGGHFGATNYTNEVWRYSPEQNEWTQMSSLPIELRLAAGFDLQGFGYVAGGFNETFGTLNTTFQYNPNSNSWAEVGNLPVSLLGARAVGVGNIGFIFCGGTSFSEMSDLVYRFNPDNGEWYSFMPFEGGARKGALAIKGQDIRLFFGTGISAPPQNERYNDFYEMTYAMTVNESTNLQANVFPNPASEQVQLLITENSGPFLLQITDLRGVSIGSVQQYVSGSRLNIGHLAPGVYVLQLFQNEVKHTIKLIKN